MPRSTLDRLRGIFPEAEPYLMYGLTEAFRSTYLDPAEVDRRPDSIGKAIPNAEILVCAPTARAATRARRASWCTAARSSRWATGTTRSARPSASGRRRAATPAWRPPELAVWSGDTVVADEEGFLYFVGRNDEMIKTSGYRVSPTEIEEVAYATGLVRDAVALGVEDPRSASGSCSSSRPATDELRPVSAASPRCSAALPLYMVPAIVDRARRAAALPERQVRPQPAAPGAAAMTAAGARRRVRRGRR